uniref:Uncharacterized protein n=1 Tax=Sphenodon punctatus TaxID=8508 RepID=A0A8D0GNC4_SPHPU
MLLFSEEVDEKEVSDLVGSLESQLAGGRGPAEGSHPRTTATPSQQQQQGSLAGGSRSPVEPPSSLRAGEAARCPGAAVGSPAPAQGAARPQSPAPAASAAAAAGAGRGASVNSSSVQQSSSHGAAAPVSSSSSAPLPASAQPLHNHGTARGVGNLSPGYSPPAAVTNVLLLRAEAATAGGLPGAVTPAGATSTRAGLENAAPALQRSPRASHHGNGAPPNAPVVVTLSPKAGCAPAAITQVLNHQSPAPSKPDSATVQTKLTHKPPLSPALNALSNSASPAMNPAPHSSQSSVANSAPLVPNAVTFNAVSKPTVNIIGPPAATIGVAKPATAVPVVSAVPQSLSPRPAVGTAQRIVAPQLVVRPPQQTTIQLPPGFTIPPGMVLVRTESGQLVMVPQQAIAQAQVQAQGQSPASITPRL